jgi:TatA/E family protein of Tat protein translocase
VFGLGFGELIVIFVVALLVFGPKRLPELARTLGKSMNEFRRASNDLRRSIMEADTPASPAPPRGPADEVAAAALPAETPRASAPEASVSAEPAAPVRATTPDGSSH